MRKCPFTDCNAKIPDSVFACRPHWFSLNMGERSEISTAFSEYRADEIDLGELRRRQQAVLGLRGNATE